MPTPKYRQDGNDSREYTEAEYAQDAADKITNDALIAAQVAKAAERQAILDRLGLTAYEAALLLS